MAPQHHRRVADWHIGPTKFEDMTSKRIVVTAFAVALWSVAPLAAHAFAAGETTLHVAPGGDDSAAGGSDSPLATIDEAFERAQPGDTILLMDGRHVPAILRDKRATASDPITVVGSNAAVIDAGASQSALRIDNVGHVDLVDLRTNSGTNGVDLVGSTSINIDGLVVSDSTGHAISVDDSDDIELLGCRVSDSSEGIDATNTTNLLIEGCDLSSITGTAIRIDGPARLINNSIRSIGADGIVLDAGATGAILHNTIYEAGGSPFANNTAELVRTENNLGIDALGNRSASSSDFVDAASGDLRLAKDSPALDSASPSEVTTDQRGRTRPLGNGPDFGAFESSHSAPTPTTQPETTEPDLPDIPTGLGDPAVVERGGGPEPDQTDTTQQPQTVSENPVTEGTAEGPKIVESDEGDIALGRSAEADDPSTNEPAGPTTTNPPLSYRTVSDNGDNSNAAAIAAACVMLAGGAGGLAIAFARRRNPTIDGEDPWNNDPPV
jgi:parallel beta-helix repeat protein